MSYNLIWHIQNEALLLTLSGDYPIHEAKTVNNLILDELEQTQTPLSLLINAMQLNRLYNFADIRSVQTFMDHPMLKNILVASDDRLVKLAMMVIFNLSRANLYICDDWEQALAKFRIIHRI